MASIYRRKKTWWIHYYVHGKSVARSLRTRSERVALDKKRKLEALELTGQLPTPSRTALGPFLESFSTFLQATRTRKSAKNDLSYLRSFFGPVCPALELRSTTNKKHRTGERKAPGRCRDRLAHRHVPVRSLEDVTTAIVSGFMHARIVEDGIAPKTANRLREVLHRLFTYAIEHHGYVCPDSRVRHPLEGVKRIRENAPEISWLDHAEIAKQLRALEHHPVIYALVATLIYAGLRREEALWLTQADVHLERRLLRIQAKTVDAESWQPKTKRNRVVPMSNALVAVLEEYKPPCRSTSFFPSPGGKRWDPDNFSARLRAINEKENLSWSCLDFRHTFGSHLAQKGESLFKIAELMGNSPEICRRHYAALVPEKMHDVVEFA